VSFTPCKNCEHIVFWAADICENCGVNNPGSNYTAKEGAKTSGRSDGIGALGSRATQATSSKQASKIASRLKMEAQVAITWSYVAAWIFSVIFGIAFLVVLFSNTDGWSKFVAFLATAVLVLIVWVQTMFVVPFYSYMSMRAHEVSERDQR
jgi:hypothetical protein